MILVFLPRTARPVPLRDARRRSTIKLLYGPGIASPGLARLRYIVHMVSLYNIYTDTLPPRARPGPPRPSSASGGPPAAARCGGVTNPTTEHRDAVGRSEAQVGECIAHPGLSPGPINRRLRRRAQELVFTRSKCVPERVNHYPVGFGALVAFGCAETKQNFFYEFFSWSAAWKGVRVSWNSPGRHPLVPATL